MARLPDFQALGARPDVRSGRPVSTVDTTGVGDGMVAFGKSVGNAGATVSAIGEAESKKRDDLEGANARSSWLTSKVKLDEERDNYTTPEEVEKHRERYNQAMTSAAGAYSDPAKRQRFLLDNQPTLASAEVQTNNRAFNLKRDRFLASSQTELDQLREAGLKAKTDEDRKGILEAGNAKISGLVENGYVSNVDAERIRKNWIDGYVVGRLNMLSPSERIEALRGPVTTNEASKGAFEFFTSKGWSPAQAAGIVGNLMHESGLRTGARNAGDGRDGSDSIGIAQWNSGRAERLKRYASARGTDWKDFQTQLEFVDLELRTSHESDKLLKAQTAKDAAAAFVTDFEKPAGSQRGAEFSHGWQNRLRHSETFLSTYAGGAKPASPDGAGIASLIPSDKRSDMLERAYREEEQNYRAQEKERQAQSFDIKRSIGDDLASLESRGTELQGLTRERVASTLGEEAANDWEAERGRARKIHSALDGIESLPEGEVERRLQGLEPKAGEAGFVDDAKAYDRARKKADKFLEARRSDPALSVDAFDTVKTARQGAQYSEANGIRTIQPESAQAIVRARLTAQQELGIREPMAVTRSEARTIARQLRFIGDDDAKGMDRFMRQMQGTYGDLADEVLASSLQLENVNRELAVLATDVIGKIAAGSAPTIARARQLEIAAENQTIDTAIQGQPPPAPPPRRQAMGDRAFREGVRQQEVDRQAAGNRKPGQPEDVTFDAQDIRWLDQNRQSPDAAMTFDLKYGPKAAQKILADIDRRKGVKR